MAAHEDRTEWVQPIVVDKGGAHLDTVKAAAIASVVVYLGCAEADREPWELWLAGPFTKSVRRAKSSQVEAMACLERRAVADVRIRGSRAVAFPPKRYEDLPRELVRLQVSGTDFPRDVRQNTGPSKPGSVIVLVRSDLTTGKAAAQAAHALFAWMLDTSGPERDHWVYDVEDTEVALCDAAELERCTAVEGAVSIRDAGRTEVAPGTLTAVAWMHR